MREAGLIGGHTRIVELINAGHRYSTAGETWKKALRRAVIMQDLAFKRFFLPLPLWG